MNDNLPINHQNIDNLKEQDLHEEAGLIPWGVDEDGDMEWVGNKKAWDKYEELYNLNENNMGQVKNNNIEELEKENQFNHEEAEMMRCKVEGCLENKLEGKEYCANHFAELVENQEAKYGEEKV